MDCPVGTVKSRIFRAKERLRALLKDYGGQDLTT
jgi:DNA-directed RNA polymerase specialized sigma24 family protein